VTGTETAYIFDVQAVRQDFPILQRQIHGKPLAFLDSAASSQRPRQVIAALDEYYEQYHANVHRGVYTLSEEATYAYEEARRKVAAFIGAGSPRELVFTRNATEAINLVAYAWGSANLRAGDRILLSMMEHHANIVPWQMLAQRVGAQLDYLPLDDEGRLVLDSLDSLLTEQTRLVAISHQSNVLGTLNPLAYLAERAHAVGALLLADGAQSTPHMPIDVQQLGVDFFVFSGHKMCGPTGCGALWARRDILETMPPFLGGGSMISVVELDQSSYAEVPTRFEAGTPAIAEAIALGAAVDFLGAIGMEQIHRHEQELTRYALDCLHGMPGLTIHGPTDVHERGGAISFSLEGIHPHDVAALLDEDGIAVRAGHHCTQPLHRLLGQTATTRASVYLYNTSDEIDRLAAGLRRVQQLFS
jgi:cysteine desulfurase/selenocysteine lyase